MAQEIEAKLKAGQPLERIVDSALPYEVSDKAFAFALYTVAFERGVQQGRDTAIRNGAREYEPCPNCGDEL